MADDQDDLMAQFRDYVEQHRSVYLSSGGAEGHIMDMGDPAIAHLTPTLL